MAFLIDPSNYAGDILIVGDGNFTFSLSLAETLASSGNTSRVFATSFDSRDQLMSDEVAANCLHSLEKFTAVHTVHNVDATKLQETFPGRAFSRIIFNFPHCGGKSNIAKSRTLLEKFFACAKEAIVPIEGKVFVTLCNGQGGTPADSPQREYGNTWQVVRQAAKAGLLLNEVHKFLSSEYPHYQNAGFRGKLKRSFFSYKDGVTHVFSASTKLTELPTLSEFKRDNIQGKIQEFLEKQLQLNLLEKQNHPICMVKKLMEHKFRTLQPEALVAESTAIRDLSLIKDRVQDKVMEYLGADTRTFMVSGHIIQPGCRVSPQSYPIQHQLVYVECQLKGDSEALIMKLKTFIKAFLQDMIIDFSCKEDEENADGDITAGSLGNSNQENSADDQLSLANSPSMAVTVKKCNCSQSTKDCACGGAEVDSRGFCVSIKGEDFWDESLEKNYSSPSSILCNLKSGSSFFGGLHPHKTYSIHNEKANLDIATFAVIPEDCLEQSGGKDKMEAVAVCINLDHLAMLLYDIPDIRWLWTEDQRLLQQFEKKDLLETCPVHFIPHSLYPDTFLHDICFWVQDGTSEELFFALIHMVTQNCVREINFMHRYLDPVSSAISYCYRMEYQRCDGAFTKEDSVNLQNLLRQILMLLNFGLK